MKKLTTVLLIALSFAFAMPASAAWTPAPLDVQIVTATSTATLTATGAVTLAAGAPASSQRWITALSMTDALPSTGTVAVAVISGGSTNTIATLTNGTAWAVSAGWLVSADTLRLTRYGATNLPSVALTFYASPVVTNITLYAGDQWQICGAHPSSGLTPAATTNTVALSASYYGGASDTLATFTNASAAYLTTSPAWLSLFDSVTLTATRLTNSPSLRIVRQRWID